MTTCAWAPPLHDHMHMSSPPCITLYAGLLLLLLLPLPPHLRVQPGG